MRIAIPVKNAEVSGHAGQAHDWHIYDCSPGAPLPAAQVVRLAKEQVLHHFKDDAPHPLDGVELVIAASAGDGFVRHMRSRGAEVLLTGERAPLAALQSVLAGEALPDTRFDVTRTLCRLRDLFSSY